MHHVLIDVPKGRLTNLTKEKAVDLIEKLVHIDARESGISPDTMSFSLETDSPDGGIDGKVDGSDKKSDMGTIKKGTTCYQIKSGGQRPNPSTIKKILRTDGGELKPGIKRCFDKDGTLVMVFVGVDPPAQSIDDICDHPEEYVPEYKNARLEIWTQAHLRQFLKLHPRLSLQILGIDDDLFCPYQKWASQEYMRNDIFLGAAQQDFINSLKQKLPRRSTKHIRVIGEPGIGKTRLVLETLRAQFSNSCLYIDNPGMFYESNLFRYVTTRKDKSRIVLVVDECEESRMVEIWSRVKHIPQISLITIYNEPGHRMRDMINFEVPPLEDEQIKDILKLYISSDYADKWYKECRPSPRAAHIIGDNLKHNTGDVLQPPSDARVWDKYIASQTELDGPEFKERKKILLWISLFKSFGERESYPGEYKIIEKILKDEVGILPATMSQTIAKLKRMKILQGSSMLYITPKVLHVWLRRQWDKEYDKGLFPLDEMADMAKADMTGSNVLEWYMDTFKYADYTSYADNVTDDFFKPAGFVDRHALLDSHTGADLFYSASKADTEKAVGYLYRHATSKDGLLEFNAGQRQAVMVLSDAVMDRHLFERSARMLLLLGAAESRGGISDADQLFVSLFSPALGPVGRMAMPLSGRLPLILEALDSDMSECRLLGIRACKAALQARKHIRDTDYDVWQRVKAWTPKFRTEYANYCADILDIIRGHLDGLDGSERSRLAEVALSCTRGLLAIPEMHDAVLSLLDMIHGKQYARNESIIDTITDCISYDRNVMPTHLRKSLERLRDKVTGSGYSALMRRYVSMSISGDQMDEGRLHQKAIEKLVEQSLDLKKLEPELDWLVTDKAVHGHWFGCALGKLDGGASFSRIHNAQRRHKESKAVFLGGYLYAVFHRDVEEWEDIMDLLAKDDILYSRVPALTYMSGMTDRAAVRIRDLVMSGLDPTVLRDFAFGTMIRRMSEERFAEWLRLLASGNAKTYETALNLYRTYYVHDDMSIPDSVSKLLFPNNGTEDIQIVSRRAEQDWSDILAAYARQNPNGVNMIEGYLKMIMSSSNTYNHLYDRLLPALMFAAERYPAKTWKMVSGFIDPAKNKPRVYYNTKSLLSMNGAALASRMPLDAIFEWTDKDKERRAPLVAYLIYNDIDTATKFAAKYGKNKKVTRLLLKNLNERAIDGSVSKHCKKEIKAVDSLIKKESDAITLEFLQRYKDRLADRCSQMSP